MAEPVACEKKEKEIKTAEPEGNHSVGLCNGTSGEKETEVCDQKLEASLPDVPEMKEKAATEPALAVPASQSQEKQICEDLQKPTQYSDDATSKNKDAKEHSEDADCSNITSSEDVSDNKTQEAIHEQAQKLLGKNYPLTIEALTPNVLQNSSITESENIDSSSEIAIITDLNPAQSTDGYHFRNRKLEKFGQEVTNAYEELVNGKEGSPESVNVAARKLLSDHSEPKVPEYFQKTLKKEKPVETNLKIPIPRSEFGGPVNLNRHKEFMKNAVKPTVSPCTHYVKEVTMDMQIISHIPSSVVTLNKDGTEKEEISELGGNGKKRIPIVNKSQKLGASEDNTEAGTEIPSSVGKSTVQSKARKSCANGINKKANNKARIRNALKARKSKYLLSSILSAQNNKYSSSEDSDDSNSYDDSNDTRNEDLYIPPPHLKRTARKTFPRIQSPRARRNFYTARKSVPSLSSKKHVGEVINKTIKKNRLHAANKKRLLPQSNNDGVVANYVMVPIKMTSSSESVEVQESRVASVVNLPETLKIQVNGLISKQKVPVTVNSLLKKTSRKIVGIRRGKRKRKAPRRFQSSQSSDDEKPVPLKKRLLDRRRDPRNRGNEERKTSRALQIKTFKNKDIKLEDKKEKVGLEQENILSQNTLSKFILTSRANQQLKCVKSSKANILLSTEIVKGKTVNELINIVDRSKIPMKNGERPLSILLPASAAVSNLLSPTNIHTQRYLLQESMPIVLPITTTVTSPGVNALVKDKLVDESIKDGEGNTPEPRPVTDTRSIVNLNENNTCVNKTNVSETSQEATSTLGIDQTKCHSDSKKTELKHSNENLTQANQPVENDIQEIVEIQQSKINSTFNDKDILPQTVFVKEREKSDNIFSMLNAIKQESKLSVERDIQATKTTPDSIADTVKLKAANGSKVARSVDMSVVSVSNHDGIIINLANCKKSNAKQKNVAEISVNDVASKITVAKTDSSKVCASGVSEDVQVFSVQENAVTVEEDTILENGVESNETMKDTVDRNDLVENAEEDMSVGLNQDVVSTQDGCEINQLENKQNDDSLDKKSDDKPKKRRKMTSQYRAKLMRTKSRQKKMEAMSGQNASAASVDSVSQPGSRSSSVSTVASLDDCRISTGTFESTRTKDVKVKPALCCCQIDLESSDTNSGICQAVEYIDGGLLLCKEEIEKSALFQPSLKIPAITLCKDHRSKARVHGWCPGCGCFCSMGTFMECRREHTRHHFHSECIGEINNVLLCPHCGEDASRAHKVTNVVPEELSLITPQELQSRRQITLPTALLETVESSIVPSVAEQHYESTKKRARMGGKQLYLPREFEDREQKPSDSVSVLLTNGRTINSDLLPHGPTKTTLTAALKCINTFKSKKLGFCPKNLYLPSVQGDLMKVIALLVDGFDPNHRFPEHNYETAMHAAANKGHHAILYILLQAGGTCDSMDEDTQTPLMCAASNKQLECLKQLVFHGADVACKDDEGTASLHIAAKDGFIEGVRYLTSLPDTDVNIQDDGGWTPLVWAAEARHLNVVQHLLDRGCDPNIKDQEGNSGLHWAAYAGAHDIIKLFIESNCDVNAVNHNGDTPLHIAAREDRYESVVTLLMREANTLLKNREKDTALDCCNAKSNVYLALQVNQKIRHAAALRTIRSERILSKDISRGREARQIQVVNAVDDFSFPSDFMYVANSCEKSSLNIDRRIIHMKGCKCDDDCSLDSCFCAHSSTKCWYNKNGKLVDEFNYQDPPLIFECGRACNCWTSCKNRVVQHGIRCHLQLFRTKQMGWGLRALQRIPKGTFICEYAGELISDEEADRRQDDSYLFDLDNREGDVYCIDARYYGNISRFINHLCDPNIVPVRTFIDHHDLRFPRIVFYTSRDVNAYEELGFDYGDKFWAIKSKYFNCCCGSPYCKHPLPRPDQEPEDTEEEIIVD